MIFVVLSNAFEGLPFDRDTEFIGREDILEQIALKVGSSHRLALVGLGGVG